MSSSSQNPDRDAYIAGLRELADWLEKHPDLAWPRYSAQVAVPLRDNANVEAFALEAGLDVATDDAGNASVTIPFGGLAYYVHGYANWDQHIAQHYEDQARGWATKNDMVIQPREGGDGNV